MLENRDITIPFKGFQLNGFLDLPEKSRGIVIFAHGSGSSRFSTRNQYVAAYLQKKGFGTVLFDLLTRDEENIDTYTRQLRFDIPLLSSRLVGVTQWLSSQKPLAHLPFGYFGASTGAAAALRAATALPTSVACVVSRGGRPDLAGDSLAQVRAPTLLIVGERDVDVLRLNREAQHHMPQTVTRLEIVRHATHLFEEPGTLERVAELAAAWFLEYCRLPAQREVAQSPSADTLGEMP